MVTCDQIHAFTAKASCKLIVWGLCIHCGTPKRNLQFFLLPIPKLCPLAKENPRAIFLSLRLPFASQHGNCSSFWDDIYQYTVSHHPHCHKRSEVGGYDSCLASLRLFSLIFRALCLGSGPAVLRESPRKALAVTSSPRPIVGFHWHSLLSVPHGQLLAV